MSENSIKPKHPFASLLFLLLLVLCGAIVFSLLGMLIGGFIFGMDEMLKATSGQADVRFLKVLQITSAIGTFIIPAWFFARSEGQAPASYFKLNTSFYPVLIILSLAIMFSAAPLLEWTVGLNQKMQLPDFLKGVEQWMRLQEDKMAEITRQLLAMHSISDLLINLLMIALIPALGEELIFRGAIQKTLTRWTQNQHLGVWLAAIIFSAIHLQFYGFLPRMLLGALFGYLLLWSNNLWFPIIGHFINNGTAVIAAYIYQRQGLSIEQSMAQNQEVSAPVYLVSLMFTVATLWIFYQYTRQKAITNPII